eukprot:CAMPEP_0167764684 /NCGR_PEP_ID=MMETSP0110_2-20121227/14198_1 /TAXON_ID=629695 /ORGANISM="Gymnochlora sp., Strain CCMP2014" /LENGTH=276 /DNA_ID=CAMNT_0007652173 /DNA_START=185 /DNA_END=1015 /DNA_ORIENTATION=-
MRHMGHSGARAMHDEFEGVAPLRRQILQGGMMLGLLCGPKISKADEIVDTVEPSLLKPAVNAQYESLNDPILSYSYKVPQKTESGMALNLVTTRKPEKYSSAAPLSSNFRHRIVNSKLDFNKAIVVCMYVNPAVGILKKFPPSDWTSQQVADTILLDRLNAKSIEEGRRYLDQNVEGGDKYQDEDGTFYFVYEHLEPGKIISTATPEGRHNLAVTAARPGLDGSLYLYSLNMGCPETIWEDLKPSFYEAAKSFRIDALGRTSSEYIPPDKDPWKIL